MLGAAPREQHHLPYRAAAQRREDGFRHVRAFEFGGRAGEDAGHVEGHIAGPDDRHPLRVQGERRPGDIGMPAVPGDEVGGGAAAGQLLAGDAEAPADRGAGRVEDRVVVGEEVPAGDVGAELDAAEEADRRVVEDPAQLADDALDLLVVRRHAVAHQAVRGGQPVEQVDADLGAVLADQLLGGVEPGGAGADDGDPPG